MLIYGFQEPLRMGDSCQTYQSGRRLYDHSNRKVAIIGSGATAVILLPRLAEVAAQVTMVQRSPAYIGAKADFTTLSSLARKLFPLSWALLWECLFHITTCYLLVLFCSTFPRTAKNALLKEVAAALPNDINVSPHFEPSYMPWEQRLCLAPDGDFFAALRRSNTPIVTGQIDSVTEDGLRMQNGTFVDVDTIITATGLTMRLGGGIKLQVDGQAISWAKRLVWNGAMLDGVPNLVFMLGFTNAAWTLGADSAAMILVRVLEKMGQRRALSVKAVAPQGAIGITQRIWPLDATYRTKADHELPVYGIKGPWKPRRVSAFADHLQSRWVNVTDDLEFQFSDV